MSISAPIRATSPAGSSQAQDFVREPGRLLIDGEWVEAASGKTFETLDPATEESLGWVAHGAAEDIELAVAAARRCFDDERSDWRRMTPSERGKVIHRIGDLIERHADELADARDARQRQAARGRQGGGRRAGRRPVPLHVGLGDEDRGPHDPDLRRHLARVGVLRLHAQGAGGRRRADHPVELPVADGGLEARPGAGGRRHRGAQAGRADAAVGAATR